ncbi:uncharacterized protein BXZ73DRAFT_91218 [Epithele typhae]|uniref:uncharacterized protein n=1 Tax=Epithele typhae TaxID=378194 RepID=UPI002008A3AB|nr:uncharacterized protein BXZ73DRAFT_91218 [Epithele typhae]KAH9924626.1 hypothetical protein BXZ73DRAFT_91218 [Epithele typhae]
MNPQHSYENVGLTTLQPKPRRNKCLWIGLPAAVVAIVVAVVVGVVVSRNHKSESSNSASPNSASPSGSTLTGEPAASQAASIKQDIGLFPTGTDSQYLLPLYPSTTNSAAFSSPTFNPSNNAAFSWPEDPFKPAKPQVTTVRPDRPRLLAPAYKWQALPKLIATDPYLKSWNETIFQNATDYYNQPVVKYFLDGGSGILDNAREVKMRIKAFSYAYRMSNDTKWVDRAWLELQNAAGKGTTPFGPDDLTKWNPSHFLDTAEFTAAFAIAYDWLYDQWTPDQKGQIASTMTTLGLQLGVDYINNGSAWWAGPSITGNWNCVTMSGLTMGALALLGDDTSGLPEKVLGLTVPNALAACAFGPSSDGTWAETANYWYFGTTGHAEMTSSLMTATGSDYGLLSTNPGFEKTVLDDANAIIFYGDQYNHPEYVLYQRDQHDAPEPNSVFWYNPTVAGAFWDSMPLDHVFDNHTDQWASMRSSWTDHDALYVAIKAGTLQGHQTHNDLDAGDFVIDALGTRWAGDLGSGDYNSAGYFDDGDGQDSKRWLYYRKRTEGQNTILVDKQNQIVTAQPTIEFGSSESEQGSSTVYDVPSDSTAFFTADLTSAYPSGTTFKRGVRMLNARKQVLLQDDITSSGAVMWRMHTNATVAVDASGTSATLTIGDKKLQMSLLNAPSGAAFTTGPAKRFDDDPALPAARPTRRTSGLPTGTYSLQVLFNPQWDGMSASSFVTPPSVPVDSWDLKSHN